MKKVTFYFVLVLVNLLQQSYTLLLFDKKILRLFRNMPIWAVLCVSFCLNILNGKRILGGCTGKVDKNASAPLLFVVVGR